MSFKGKVALVNALLAKGASVSAKITKPLPRTGFGEAFLGATPFIVAAGSRDVEVMKLLLAKGADPKAPGDGGVTAIMAACKGNADTSVMIPEADRMAAIALALESGVDIEAADAKGYRAMHFAATDGYHKIIRLLLDKGADLNPITNSRTEKDYGTGGLTVASDNASAFAHALPAGVHSLGVHLREVRPLDESLESVFEELLR